MTRDEEVRNAIDTIFPIPPSENGRKYEQALMATGFEAGVKWADKHSKSPWISVKDDLPCNHEELMDGEFQTKFVIVSTNGINKYFELMYNYPPKGWIWSSEAIPKYWMPIPELSKE